jgi:hypothetical protein
MQRNKTEVSFSKASLVMNAMLWYLAALAVAALYCSWRRHHQGLMRRERMLRERVAWMLWVMASRPKQTDPSLKHSPDCI